MTGDGWAKNGDGIWAKGGKTAAFTIKTTAGNKRRELTEQILQQQLKDAGFNMTIKNQTPDDLFGKILPAGNYQLALYAQTATSLEPGPLLASFCSKNIPSDGERQLRPELDAHQHPGARPAAADRRHRASTTPTRIAAGEAGRPAHGARTRSRLPLDPLPNILLWSNKIIGPVGDNPILVHVLEHERVEPWRTSATAQSTDDVWGPGSAHDWPSPGHIRGGGGASPRC